MAKGIRVSVDTVHLRDKRQREVDFLVARDGKPWFQAEVKRYDKSARR